MGAFNGLKRFLEDVSMGLIGGGVGGAGGLKPQPQQWQQRIGGGGVPTSPSSQMLQNISTMQQNHQYAQPTDFAQMYYPGRTNYGVPQDNMIDTSMGYITPEQFNQAMSGRLQRQVNPMGYTPGYNQEVYTNLQGGAPGFTSYGVQYPQGYYIDQNLRVR